MLDFCYIDPYTNHVEKKERLYLCCTSTFILSVYVDIKHYELYNDYVIKKTCVCPSTRPGSEHFV